MKSWSEIRDWRRERRAELIAARAAVAPAQRDAWSRRITALLAAGFDWPAGAVIGFCWPYKGECDARFVVRRWRESGAVAALPEVVEKARPLRFGEWWPGAPMRPGVYDIPVPDGTRTLLPDAVIIPMNGFDDGGYRLGYGGGYFDRTLALLEPKALAIGVSFEALHLPTIYPQPHDVPMDFVVTEAGIHRAGGIELTPLDPAMCRIESARLLESRALPRDRQTGPKMAAQAATAMTTEEINLLLNTLLEAERAGAKALAFLLDDCRPAASGWRELAAVQRDEAGNCAILIGLIHGSGGVPSTATGDFLRKMLAVRGSTARLQFLNRGQQWVVRRIDEALPRLSPGPVRDALLAMRVSHLLNIETCDALVETLEA